MPWFKVDDTAHSHPKLRKAGTAAAGLWMFGGSYAAQYLTDGVIHAHFVASTGTPVQVAKLVRLGLWHPAGHACPRCPQPAEGDYVMHDYLVYNFSRTRVLADRERAAEKKRKQRAGQENASGSGLESAANRPRFGTDSSPKNASAAKEPAGHSVASPGDSRGPRARAAQPSPTLLPSEEEKTGKQASERIADCDTLRDLKRACSANGLSAVAWDLNARQIEQTRQTVERVGIQVMVEHALGSIRQFGSLPRGASAWVKGWTTLEAAPAEPLLPPSAGPNVVPITGRMPSPNSRPLSGPDANIAAHADIIATLAAQENNR